MGPHHQLTGTVNGYLAVTTQVDTASYAHEIKYQVGQRVRVDIPIIPPEHTNCKTGLVTAIKTRFPRSPDCRVHFYTVRFDEHVIIPEFVFIQQIHELSVEAEQLEAL